MKAVKKKRLLVISISILLLTGSYIPTAYAGLDNIGFTFHMPAFTDNTYSESRYRQTKHRTNPWMVNFTYNTEGQGCKATFFLTKSKGKIPMSEEHTLKAFESGMRKYKDAYGGAQQTNVCLGCHNNNYTKKEYVVGGTWDEETW